MTLLIASWLSQWDTLVWTMTQYLGPLLFLGIWSPFTVSFLDLEWKSITKTFPVIFFGSILVVLGALLLNNRLLFLFSEAISGIFIIEDPNQTTIFIVYELIAGIILPANEEITKIIPIVTLAHAPIVIFNPEKTEPTSDFETHQSIMTRRQYAFYGVLSGSIFTFLELFLYQWQSSGSEIEMIFMQILFRTLTPLHVLTTLFVALGIGTLKIKLLEEQGIKRALVMSSGYFVLGWVFHSLWNTINIYYEVYSPGSEAELAIILAIFGAICDIILLTTLLIVGRYRPRICSQCGFEKSGYHSHIKKEVEDSTPYLVKIPLLTFISVKKLRKQFSCPFCLNPLLLGACSKCGARIFLTCPQCYGFISETTSSCPHCFNKIKPFIELRMKALSLPETLIIGVTALASVAFLLAPISILLFSQMGDVGSLFTPILVFYFIMSLTALASVVIALFINRTTGILVLSCFFLELGLLIFTIIGGTWLTGIARSIFTLDILGFAFLCLVAPILFYLGYRFIHTFYSNYSPIFPEYRTNSHRSTEGGKK